MLRRLSIFTDVYVYVVIMTYRENGICFSLYTNNDFMRAALVASDYGIYTVYWQYIVLVAALAEKLYIYIYIHT